MKKRKFKYLFADEGGIIVDEEWVSVVKDDKDELRSGLGAVLHGEIDAMIESGKANYGVEVEYTIKPINKDPFNR